MIGSYLKIALKNLYRNKLYSIINIFGLGVAMALCVVAYVNYQFGQSFDTFHKNAENIYFVNMHRAPNETRQDWAITPSPLTPAVPAFLVLLLACFNFINTAVAFASRRLNEIGVRKTLGGTNPLIRVLLTFQFALAMSVIITAVIMTENAKYIDTFDLGYPRNTSWWYP